MNAPDTKLHEAAAQFWRDLADAPHDHDLFATLRWLEARHPSVPRLGRAPRPKDEPVRLGQDPSMAFAPSTLAEVIPARNGVPPRITQWAFGLFGPNGPLPVHLTEYVRERLRLNADPTLVRFADIFHHRAALLFFRSWADCQSTVSLDRVGDDRFSRHVDSLIGYGEGSHRQRDTVPDHAKRYAAGHLVRQTRNPEGLVKILSRFFSAPVALLEYRRQWLPMALCDQTSLVVLGHNNRLGVDAIAGTSVPDCQHRFRLCIGPLSLAQYTDFLPLGRALRSLADWVRNYIGYEFDWDVLLVLRRQEVPALTLGGQSRLGWTTWLDQLERKQDAEDLVIEPETLLARTEACLE